MTPGEKPGPYEIVSLLGKGGMVEVWKAHDPRLNRDGAFGLRTPYTGFVAFRGVDYLLIDSLFSEQELMVRQTARRFVRDCFRDGAVVANRVILQVRKLP